MAKIQGVRFNSDTGKIEFEREDGTTEVIDEGYDLSTQIGRSPAVTKAASAVSGALDPITGGDDYYKTQEPAANIAGRVGGSAAGMFGILKSLAAGGGKVAAKKAPSQMSLGRTRKAQQEASDASSSLKDVRQPDGWIKSGDLRYKPAKGGQVIRDLNPINIKKVSDAVGHGTARKLEKLGATAGRELSENQILRLDNVVKRIPFDDLKDPRVVNAVKKILEESVK